MPYFNFTLKNKHYECSCRMKRSRVTGTRTKTRSLVSNKNGVLLYFFFKEQELCLVALDFSSMRGRLESRDWLTQKRPRNSIHSLKTSGATNKSPALQLNKSSRFFRT